MDGTLALAHERLIEAYTALVSCERYAPVGRTVALSHHVLRMASATGIRAKESLTVGRAMLHAEQSSKRTGHTLARTKCHLAVDLTFALGELPKRNAPIATIALEECETMDRALVYVMSSSATTGQASVISKRSFAVHFAVSNCHSFSKAATSALS